MLLKSRVDKVKAELMRMQETLDDMESENPYIGISYPSGKYTATVKRCSMDLSNALVGLRKSQYAN